MSAKLTELNSVLISVCLSHCLCTPWPCVSGGWFPLGSLRPDLYQLPKEPSEWAEPGGSSMRLCFALQYYQEKEQLVVSLLRAANLPAHCQGSATLVKLQLLPSDDRRHRQAKARCKGSQPQFNDSFVFQVHGRWRRFIVDGSHLLAALNKTPSEKSTYSRPARIAILLLHTAILLPFKILKSPYNHISEIKKAKSL